MKSKPLMSSLKNRRQNNALPLLQTNTENEEEMKFTKEQLDEALAIQRELNSYIAQDLLDTYTKKYNEFPDMVIEEAAAEYARIMPMVEWQPIETAPSDVSVLLKLRDDLEKFKIDEPERWNGLEFVGRRRSDNHDLFGWSFAAPVGMGGFPDQWFVGWKHINSPILKRLIGEV